MTYLTLYLATMPELLRQFLDLFGQPEFTLIEAHRASTHLSIGLLVGAALFDCLAAVARKTTLRDAAFCSQIMGTLLLAGTFALGFYGNPVAGDRSDLGQRAQLHFYAGCAVLGIFGVLALWRIIRARGMGKIEIMAYSLLTLAGLAAITVTGWMGSRVMG
jgi:uncharacterized membrane protein